MKEITLTRGMVAIIDDEDFERVIQLKWYALKTRSGFYAVSSANLNGKTSLIYMHRLIAGAPNGKETDHWNGDTLDNTRGNLRPCDTSQNQHNCGLRKDNTTGFVGVCFTNGKFSAMISINKKYTYLGRFSTAIDAAKARDLAAKKHHGSFANFNFPESMKG